MTTTGSRGTGGLTDVKELRWSGDEQPLEASALADAQAAWFRLSGESDAARAVERAWSWFLGNNRLGEPIIDLHSGAGRDGLGSHEVNRNCGAESTLAAHRCASTWRAVATSLPEPASNGSVRAARVSRVLGQSADPQRFDFGVLLDELEDRQVLLGVEPHRLDQQRPQRGVLDVTEILAQALQLDRVLLLVGDQRAGELEHRLPVGVLEVEPWHHRVLAAHLGLCHE